MLKKSFIVMGAGLLAAAMWLWVQQIAIPHQQAEAAELGAPRGNLSDLYPRWLGARELLLNRRDPYSADLTREIQSGYYGRLIDPSRPHDPRDQQAFAYPVYVVLVLAPTVGLPFSIVQRGFLWFLVLLTAGSIPVWLHAVGWRISTRAKLVWILLTMGCFPAIQGFKLQQLTLLVAGLLAAAMYALAHRHFVWAGALFALATIKPQLAALVIVWLVVWMLGKWRERQALLWSFAACMAMLVVAGEVLLPGWIGEFRRATAEYYQYTGGGRSILDVALTPVWGRAVAVLVVGVVFAFLWQVRKADEQSADFGYSLALVMAATLVVIPMFAPYNQLLLVPALMVIVRAIRPLWRRSRLSRFFVGITALSIFWPWIAAVLLVVAHTVAPGSGIQRAWALPIYTSLTIPITVLALLLVSRSVLRQENAVPGARSVTLQPGAASE